MARWASREQTVQFLVDRNRLAMTARDIATYLQARGMPTFGERLLATSTIQAAREQRQPRTHRSTTSGVVRQSARPRPGHRTRSLPVVTFRS